MKGCSSSCAAVARCAGSRCSMALRKSVHAGDSWGGKRSCWPEEIENSTLESQLLLLEPYPGHHACMEHLNICKVGKNICKVGKKICKVGQEHLQGWKEPAEWQSWTCFETSSACTLRRGIAAAEWQSCWTCFGVHIAPGGIGSSAAAAHSALMQMHATRRSTKKADGCPEVMPQGKPRGLVQRKQMPQGGAPRHSTKKADTPRRSTKKADAPRRRSKKADATRRSTKKADAKACCMPDAFGALHRLAAANTSSTAHLRLQVHAALHN
eukprot:1160473-Pelagomonas_calceolata.AAC.7